MPTTKIRHHCLVLMACFVSLPTVYYSAEAESIFPDSYQPIGEYTGQTIWDLPELPEQNVDIGLWSLVIAREYDSTVDVQGYLDALDGMAAEIKRMTAGRDFDMAKFLMTKMFLYDQGIWNDSNVFTYDLDDPFGDDPRNRLLSTCLDTRKGNCVSMPTLFLALMERVDPDVPFRAVLAPLHTFCRFHDRQEGKIWNVETTNGGSANRDEWYVENLHIPQVAIDSGVFLTDMTKKQFLAELIGSLAGKSRDEGDYDKGLRYADLILALNPRSISGLVFKGALLAWKGQALLDQITAAGHQPTVEEHALLSRYEDDSGRHIERAGSLGWSPESARMRQEYLQTIEAEKNK